MRGKVKRLLRWLRGRPKRPMSLEERDEAVISRLRAQGMRIGEGCRIYASDFSTEPYLITIGSDVGIAGGVRILTHNGAARQLKDRRPRIQSFGRVTIGDHCFIGENAILLPGTTVGSGSIVGAGAVVAGTMPENALIVGNPAKPIGRASLYLERLARSPGSLDTFGLPEDERRRIILARFPAGVEHGEIENRG